MTQPPAMAAPFDRGDRRPPAPEQRQEGPMQCGDERRHVVGATFQHSLQVRTSREDPAVPGDDDGRRPLGEIVHHVCQLLEQFDIERVDLPVLEPNDGDPTDMLHPDHAGHPRRPFPDAAGDAPGGAAVPNRVFTSERRDPAYRADAAGDAPGGAAVPNRVFTSERRDPGTAWLMRLAMRLEAPPCRTGCSPLNDAIPVP